MCQFRIVNTAYLLEISSGVSTRMTFVPFATWVMLTHGVALAWSRKSSRYGNEPSIDLRLKSGEGS